MIQNPRFQDCSLTSPMYLASIMTIIDSVRMAFKPDVTDHGLNPVRLAIATWGYWIQSQALRIPDRFGYFSPGPPRLQVHEATNFLLIVLCIGPCTIFFGGLAALMLKLLGKPVTGLIVALCGLTMATMGFSLAAHETQRASDYKWDDWKMRQE